MESVVTKKSPFLAATLAVLVGVSTVGVVWGIGHFYAGQWKRGAVWLGTGVLFWLGILATLFAVPWWVGSIVTYTMITGFVVHVIDAFIQANKVNGQ